MTREEALNKVRQMSLPKETMEILEALVPELAESEDERIRKTLVEYISDTMCDEDHELYHISKGEALAYLEKQGEQKVSVDDFKAKDWYVSKVDGKIHNIYYSVDKVKPKFKVGDKIIEKNFDECGRGTIIDIKDGKYIFDDGGFICIEEQGLWKLVEQKPAEYIKRNSKEWYSLLAEQYDKGFWKGKAEQKPAEWSDTKELVFKDICNHLEVEGYSGWVVLLNALRNGEFQPKQEWSEEDEKMLQSIIKDFRAGKVSTIGQERWLKSLRPQQRQEWSDEEKEILDSILSHYVLIDKPIDANGIPKEKYISLIKSIRFDTYKNCNSHWKPSEEQMKSLDIYRKVPLKHSIDREMLDSLYEQLKKLM